MMQTRNSREATLRVFKFLALALVLLTYSRSYAQVVGARVSGTVTDPSGAAIPQAQISIKNLATGVSTAIVANSDGFYTAPNLLPGRYEMRATASGFATEVRSGITLTVGAQQVMNLTLTLGQTSQTIEVTG